MAYTDVNFKTKKAFKEAVKRGDIVTLWSPGMFSPPSSGKTTVEGPHYPEPHKWYAEVMVIDGHVTAVQ